MFAYHVRLAFVSFRRNPVLAGLMVLAIALGVAMSMSAFTVLHVMARDPIPEKSTRLFAVQIDNGGPRSRAPGDDEPPPQLTYRDAVALLAANGGARQAAMHQVSVTLASAAPGARQISVSGRATSADFFAMFDVPLRFGRAWTQTEEASGTRLVVLSAALNDRLFGGENSVGRDVELSDKLWRVVGVADAWDPKPRFFDVIGSQSFDEGEDIYLPLKASVDEEMSTAGYEFCDAGPRGTTFADLLRSECVWLQYWVELPTSEDAARYRDALANYSAEQRTSGRFNWAPNARLRDVRAWLVARHVVSDDARLSTVVAFAFFAVCLVCALGLMLARSLERAGEFSLRRALGASRATVFSQAATESVMIGATSGVLGVVLTMTSLWLMRSLFPAQLGRIAWMDRDLVVATVALSALATLIAGLYPAWRAMRTPPALQLKGGQG